MRVRGSGWILAGLGCVLWSLVSLLGVVLEDLGRPYAVLRDP